LKNISIFTLSLFFSLTVFSQSNSLRNSSVGGNQSSRMPSSEALQPSSQYPGKYICKFNNATHTDCNEDGVPHSYLNQYSNKYIENSNANNNMNMPASEAQVIRERTIADCVQVSGLSSSDCEAMVDTHINDAKPSNAAGSARNCTINPITGACESNQEQMGPPESAANQGPNSQEIATIYQCESAKVNADSACDSESKNWMRTINQVSGLLGSQLNQGACGTLAAAQTGSAASLTLFSMQCGQAVDKCLTECRKTIAATNASADVQLQQINKDAADYARACNAKGASAKKTEADVGDGIQQIAQAVQACRASFGTAAVDPNLQIPDYVGKPQGDILAGLQQRNDQGLNYEGTGSGLTGDRNANIDLSDLVDDTPAVGAAKPRGMGQDPGGQQGSAGLGGGGGVGVDASSGRAANRKGNTGLLSNILSGFFGSGGGGLFGGGKAAGNRGGGGGQVAAAPAGATTPDLRQFLPGAKFDPKKERNIAGRIVSKDGIIGPHGNLWRDISNRYQVKRASLLP